MRALLTRCVNSALRFAGFGGTLKEMVKPKTAGEVERVFYIANEVIPTLQLSFYKPLQPLVDVGQIVSDTLTAAQMKAQTSDVNTKNWVLERLQTFKPSVMIFCRYSGPYVPDMLAYASQNGIPTIFHLDDDLLGIPKEIGQKKYEYHNHPSRLEAVRTLLGRADFIYFSTDKLKERFESKHRIQTPSLAGKIYCSGEVMAKAQEIKPLKIGYMGFDHAHDFELALPALIDVLDAFPDVVFELFGSIPKPAVLERFGARISVIEPVRGYSDFMKKFASLGWAIGICPLADTEFNAVKANTKWVEYTSVGAATIATGGTIYDGCCADGCGVLAISNDDWKNALSALITDNSRRLDLVKKAQKKLQNEYSVDALRHQVLEVIARAKQLKHSHSATHSV